MAEEKNEQVEEPKVEETAPAAKGEESEATTAAAETAADAPATEKPAAKKPAAKKPAAKKPAAKKPAAKKPAAAKATADAKADSDADADADADASAKPAAKKPAAKKAPAKKPEAKAEETKAAPKPRPTRRRAAKPADAVTVRAQAKFVRSSARKARLVCDHIREQDIDRARAILQHSPRAVARDWSKLLESAVANAEHNHALDAEDLKIVAVFADEGPTIKRFQPRAQGRAFRIRKRTSHLTVVLGTKE